MDIADTIDQIETLAETTGINLDAATAPSYKIAEISRALRNANNINMGDARTRAANAVNANTIDEFTERWNGAVEIGIAATLRDELYDYARDALYKREEKAAARAPWVALELLQEHVTKLGRDLTKLNIAGIRTAETAIATGATKDYTKANDLIEQLHEIATLPEIDHRDMPLWVIVAPPVLPEARAAEDNYKLRLADDHPDDEMARINQATDINSAGDFREQLITALTYGWEISAATSAAEYKTRSRAHHKASHISNAAVTTALSR